MLGTGQQAPELGRSRQRAASTGRHWDGKMRPNPPLSWKSKPWGKGEHREAAVGWVSASPSKHRKKHGDFRGQRGSP